MIDRKIFFAYVRNAPFGGRLTRAQIAGMEAMLAAWQTHGDGDLRKLANGFAQCFRETGGRMVPVREGFALSTAGAIAALNRAWKAGRLGQVSKPYWRDGWFGRGRIQATHLDNYKFVQQKTGLDCVGNPDVLLTEQADAKVFWPSLFEGWWTRGRHKFSTYFNDTTDDPKGARRIVNGNDKAALIAGYHRQFLDALQAASGAAPSRPDEAPAGADQPDDVAPEGWSLRSLWSLIFGGGFVLPFGIDNPWAFATIAVVIVVAAGFGIAWQTGWITINRRRA